MTRHRLVVLCLTDGSERVLPRHGRAWRGLARGREYLMYEERCG